MRKGLPWPRRHPEAFGRQTPLKNVSGGDWLSSSSSRQDIRGMCLQGAWQIKAPRCLPWGLEQLRVLICIPVEREPRLAPSPAAFDLV